MLERLQEAIQLREAGSNQEASVILLSLVALDPDDAQINYHIALAYSRMSRERDALPFYERAIAQGLSRDDLLDAFVGLGNTYRCLGDYKKAIATFQRGLSRFPESRTLQIFLALTLYNTRHYEEAMEIVLWNLAETTNDKDLLRHQKTLLSCIARLSDTWK
jgi:tetratricopeptide (TPR) repeat protein